MFCSRIICSNSVLWCCLSDLKHQHKGSLLLLLLVSRVDLMLCVSQGSCRSRRGLYWWTAPAHSDGFRSREIWSAQRCPLSAQDMWASVPFTLCHICSVSISSSDKTFTGTGGHNTVSMHHASVLYHSVWDEIDRVTPSPPSRSAAYIFSTWVQTKTGMFPGRSFLSHFLYLVLL